MTQLPDRSAFAARLLPAQQVEELRAIQALVNELAGLSAAIEATLPTATLDSLYDNASPIAQRCFDALAQETSAVAMAGLSALTSDHRRGDASAAAALLAREMERAIAALERILRWPRPAHPADEGQFPWRCRQACAGHAEDKGR